jgi:hypothetical protein
MPVVRGTVVEKYTRNPVNGATVRVNGSTTRTMRDGSFSVEVPQRRITLTVSHPDYHGFVRALTPNRAVNQLGLIALDSRIRALG